MVKMFVNTWDEHGDKVRRVGSPALFFLICIILFFTSLAADQRSCIRGQGNRTALLREAVEDQTIAGYWNAHGRSKLAAVYTKRAQGENLRQLHCSFFFPQVHGR